MQHHTALRSKFRKENESICYQNEEHDQRMNVEQQGPEYTLQDYWNLAHEAHVCFRISNVLKLMNKTLKVHVLV